MPIDYEQPVSELGSGLTIDAVNSGTGTDAYVSFVKTNIKRRVWITIETFAATITFFSSGNGSDLAECYYLTGVYEIDFATKGCKIKNRVVGSNCLYQFRWLR